MELLTGFSVAITASRLVREQTVLFERQGAAVRALPLVGFEPSGELAIREVVEKALTLPHIEVAVFSTGFGTRWLFSIADAAGSADQLRDALAGAYVVARGPKAHGALTTAGVHVDWQAPDSLGRQVVEHVVERTRPGDRVLVQLDGASDDLTDQFGVHDLHMLPIRTYRCAPASAELDLPGALDELDAITFTSRVAVDGLTALGGDRYDEIVELLNRRVVGAVGPVTARALHDLGVHGVLTPPTHRLGAMVRVVCDELRTSIRTLAPGVALHGSAVVVDGDAVPLTPGERRLLLALVDASGAVVGKNTLARASGISGSPDHAVEAAITRLRRRLGAHAAMIETVPRRGYRLATAARLTR
jgi:uroporphyrinogen-III synthase